MIGKKSMSLSPIRRSLGVGWFCLLSILTAGIIVSMDYEIGSLQSALTTHLLSTVIIAIPIALLAVWPLITFKKKRWGRGLLTTFAMGVVSYIALQLLITSSALPSLRESLLFVAVAGTSLMLISLPSALFLSRS